jgi:hypothetical protein
VVQRLEPVKAEQEVQDHLLTRPEAREMGLGPGRVDRQDGQVFGCGHRIGEPVDGRSRTVVIGSVEGDQGERVAPPRASIRREPARVNGRC